MHGGNCQEIVEELSGDKRRAVRKEKKNCYEREKATSGEEKSCNERGKETSGEELSGKRRAIII
jgi:hypothetical protein